MSIFVFGLNHKTTPVALREKAYFAPDKLSLYVQDLLSLEVVDEAVVLSTCNRSEVYCEAKCVYAVREWFAQQTGLTLSELDQCAYIHRDEAAVAHIMEVACGLDSMVLGEPQILGQMKEAFSESCAVSAVGALFHRLFQHVFSVAKEIRTSTAIGACPVSVASASVHFARQQVADFANANILLIGAGDTTQLLLKYLQSYLAKPVTVVNRNVIKAAEMMEGFAGRAYGFDRLYSVLSKADIVFSATGSATPIVNQAMMSKAMQSRPGQPITFVDVAVPRDIDPDVANVANTSVFCIDDLKSIITKNRQGREHAALKAHDMIKTRSAMFIDELQSIDKVAHTIRAYRGQIERLCRDELMKARNQLQQGEEAHAVLESFAHAYTNKLLHAPSVSLRQAGKEGRFEILQFAKQLFAIKDPEADIL